MTDNIRKCSSKLHQRANVNSPYPCDEVPIELFYRYEGDSNSQILKTCIHCRKYGQKEKQQMLENKKMISENKNVPQTNINTILIPCNYNRHNNLSVGSPYDKEKVPIDLFRRYPGIISSPLYKRCLQCRNYTAKMNRKRLDKINEEKKEIKEIKEIEEKKEIKEIEDKNEDVMSLDFEIQESEVEEFDKRDESKEFFMCYSTAHSYKRSKFHKDCVPKDMFLRDPFNSDKGYYKICEVCRNYQKEYKDKKLEILKKQRNDLIEKYGENAILTCFDTGHVSKGGPYEKDKVPLNMFRKDPDDPASPLQDSCIECRLYKREADKKLKHERMRLAEQQGKKYCSSGHIVDKLAKNQDDTDSKHCEKCKNEDMKQYEKNKKLRDDLKYEFMQIHECSCQKCKSIYLKSSHNKRYSKELKTYEKNGQRYVIYDNIEYLTKDFINNNRDLLEFKIIEFDHLTEQEQRERGLLTNDESYIPKQATLSSIHVSKRRSESKKCQHLCSRCHVEVSISRESFHGPRTESQKVKYEYVNNLKKCGCEVCGYKNESLLRFFEMDHLNRSTKITKLSEMVWSNTYTLEDVIKECKKCRVLCRHCHTIHTFYYQEE